MNSSRVAVRLFDPGYFWLDWEGFEGCCVAERCSATLTCVSGALQLRDLQHWCGKQPRQADQVRGAAEDESPVHLMQTAQLHLAQRTGPFKQAKVFSTSQRRMSERAYPESGDQPPDPGCGY